MNPRSIWLLLLAFCLLPNAHGQDTSASSKDLSALLAANSANNSLEASGAMPWRMKADYQLFDAQGHPTASGSYEYWWAAPGKSRTLWTRGNLSASLWDAPGSPNLVAGKVEQLRLVEREIHDLTSGSLPSSQVLAQYALSLQGIAMGPSKLRCVLLGPKTDRPVETPAPFSGYCFDQQKPQLRLMLSKTGHPMLVDLENPAPFRELSIPRHVQIVRDGKTIFTLDIKELKESAEASDSSIPPVSALPLHVQYSAEQAQAMLAENPKFVFPQRATDLNLFGHVMLRAHVGKDGHVHSVQVDSGMKILREAASENVSKLVYQPYFLAGGVSDFDVNFDVNFTPDHQMIVIGSQADIHSQCSHSIGGVRAVNPLCAATSIEEAVDPLDY
jgi:hypothetical protein